MMLLPNCGAVVNVMLGFFGLLFPKAVGRVLGIVPDRPLPSWQSRDGVYCGFTWTSTTSKAITRCHLASNGLSQRR